MQVRNDKKQATEKNKNASMRIDKHFNWHKIKKTIKIFKEGFGPRTNDNSGATPSLLFTLLPQNGVLLFNGFSGVA